MATFYKVGEDAQEVKPKDGKVFTLKEMQEMVGGNIELIDFPNGKSIVVNEEGKLIGLEFNELASQEWLKEFPLDKYPFNNDGTIVGNALILTEVELNGEGEDEEPENYSEFEKFDEQKDEILNEKENENN